jgi:hypothetical protein
MRKKYAETETGCLLRKEPQRSDPDIPPIHVVGEEWTNGSCHSGCSWRKLCSVCERHGALLNEEAEDMAYIHEKDLNIPRICKGKNTVFSDSCINYGSVTESHYERYVCCKHSHSLR